MGGAVTPKRHARSTADSRGTIPADQWEQTSVHKASAYYCGKCGERFASPDAVYDHLDAEHSKRKGSRNGRPRTD
jgi:hypothetical protein